MGAGSVRKPRSRISAHDVKTSGTSKSEANRLHRFTDLSPFSFTVYIIISFATKETTKTKNVQYPNEKPNKEPLNKKFANKSSFDKNPKAKKQSLCQKPTNK